MVGNGNVSVESETQNWQLCYWETILTVIIVWLCATAVEISNVMSTNLRLLPKGQQVNSSSVFSH
jgi:hypothetical protein